MLYFDLRGKKVQGTHLEVVTLLHNFHQLVSEPTHLLPYSSSWIDL